MRRTTRCSRCRRKEALVEGGGARPLLLPDGWEGSIAQDGTSFDALCLGCRRAAWHPLCTSIRADHGLGERVDLAALIRASELEPIRVPWFSRLVQSGVAPCGFVDGSVAWWESTLRPAGWCCPECGGAHFTGVHAD